jgi:DtxR family Mn-dependent transcriptional regulator
MDRGDQMNRTVKKYLMTIYSLDRKGLFARTTEIATAMGYKHASITGMFIKMESLGLVVYRRYKGVTLSRKGEKIAEMIHERRSTIRDLLVSIGMPVEEAEVESEKVENAMSDEALDHIRTYLKGKG